MTPDSPLWPIQALCVGGLVVLALCWVVAAVQEWADRRERGAFELDWNDASDEDVWAEIDGWAT